MPIFGRTSLERLSQCHPDLQSICHEVIGQFDFTVICGHRDKQAQNRAFSQGKSKLRYPESKHNRVPALAVDIAPYRDGGIAWDDTRSFYYLAGLVKGIAASRGIVLRWGGDWDSDGCFSDQSFNDLPHFELMEK